MFRNGIYTIDFGPSEFLDEPGQAEHAALFVIRDGAILGSDALGGVYIGEVPSYDPDNYDPDAELYADALRRLAITCEVPPDAEMITGFKAPADGASVTITGRFQPKADQQTATVMVANVPVEIAISYLGPLPR